MTLFQEQYMKRILQFLSIIFFTINFPLSAGFGSTWSSFKSSAEGIGQTFKQFGEGMAESFGLNPPGYHYSFRVFNNTDGDVSVEARRLKKLQGVMIRRHSIEEHVIGLAEETGASSFHHINIYLQVILRYKGDEVFTEGIVNMLPSYKKDKDVYFYNVYQDSAGVHGESLGIGRTTTSEFLGTVYNSLSTAQEITFKYANQTFHILIDPHSFNYLQSDKSIPNSIRPATGVEVFDFGKTGKIAVTAKGVASGKKKGGSWTSVNPMAYHYEIFQDGKIPLVATNGFVPGHFQQSTGMQLRTLTPTRCLIWNESAAQANKVAQAQAIAAAQAADRPQQAPTLVYVEPKNQTVWVAYSTPGWSDKTNKIDDTIMTQIPSGQAVQFFFIRPSLNAKSLLTKRELIHTADIQPSKTFGKENTVKVLGINLDPVDIYNDIKEMAPKTPKASLFIVSLDTTNQQKAKQFLQNLIDGKVAIPQGPSLVSSTLTEDLKSTLLSEKQSTTLGQMNDTTSGVTGYLLAYDIFTPYGSAGPFYYSVRPPQRDLMSTAGALKGYINPTVYKTQEGEKTLMETVGKWVTLAAEQKTAKKAIALVQPKVLKYLQTNGIDRMFGHGADNKLDKSKLNWLGNLGLNMIVTGPTGIVNAPVQWAAGMNHYVYTGSVMPTNTDPKTKKKVVTWKPTKTIGLNGQPAQFLPPQPGSSTAAPATTKS